MTTKVPGSSLLTNQRSVLCSPIGQVEVSALEVEEVLCEGLKSDEVAADDHGRAVVGAVVVGRGVCPGIVPVTVPLAELDINKGIISGFNYELGNEKKVSFHLVQSGLSLGPHGFGEISESLVVGEVELL